MKLLTGLLVTLLCIASVLGGLYCGVVLMLIGGIIDILREVRAEDMNSTNVAWGVAKILFCEMPIALGGYIAFGIGGCYAVLKR